MTFLSLAIMTYLMQGSGNIFYRSDEEYADIEDVAGRDMVLESEETKVEDKPEEHNLVLAFSTVLTAEGFEAVFRDEKVITFEELLLMLA